MDNLKEKKRQAARVLYNSGLFSYRDVCAMLDLPYREVYEAANTVSMERKPDRRLSKKEARQIREMLTKAEGLSRAERRARGLRQQDIARKFRIHQTTVSAIKRSLTHKEV